LIGHTRKVMSRINVLCPSEEELFERRERTRAQWIKATRESDLRKKRLGARNGHRFEKVWKYPRPISHQMVPGERHIRVITRHHLREIAMHDTKATGKAPHLGGKERVGCGFSEQRVGGGAAFGANIAQIR